MTQNQHPDQRRGRGHRLSAGQIAIDLADSAEFTLLGEICMRAYLPSGMCPNDPYYRDLQDVADRARQATVLAARVAGVPVGTVTWCRPGSPLREIAEQDDQAEIRMLAVDPDRQGRGIGDALLACCIERSRAAGLCSIVLSTAKWMTVAHQLYARRGFVRTPGADWSPRPDVQLISYRLDLD